MMRCSIWGVGLLFLLCVQPVADAHMGLHHEIEWVTRKLKRAPTSLKWLLRRGDLYRRHGDFRRAQRDLRRAVKLHPHARRVWRVLGQLYFSMRDPKRAHSALKHYLQMKGTHWQAWYLWAQLAEQKGHIKRALRAYKQAALRGKKPQLYLRWGRLSARTRPLAHTAKIYRAGLHALSGAIVMRLALFEILMKQKQHDKARQLVESELNKLPVKTPWWLLRARTFEAQGKHLLARRDRLAAQKESQQLFEHRPTLLNRMRRVKVTLSLKHWKHAVHDLYILCAHRYEMEKVQRTFQMIHRQLTRRKQDAPILRSCKQWKRILSPIVKNGNMPLP
ncbi:MAG TPA: hypothetical protein DCE42_06290 [Myxococcales bacterium]|nr:hypothetical protein [Deltaproteobacteria bacterium]HAA54344.1 hypothetical protein [Myxococcales bacterium]